MVRLMRSPGAGSPRRRTHPPTPPPTCRLPAVPPCCCLQGRRDGSTRDEPFAWQAREFLRKFCVGKV